MRKEESVVNQGWTRNEILVSGRIRIVPDSKFLISGRIRISGISQKCRIVKFGIRPDRISGFNQNLQDIWWAGYPGPSLIKRIVLKFTSKIHETSLFCIIPFKIGKRHPKLTAASFAWTRLLKLIAASFAWTRLLKFYNCSKLFTWQSKRASALNPAQK